MKTKSTIILSLCIAALFICTAFSQTSDCPPCQKDQPASPGKACCGTEEYDPETHECCGGKVVEKGKCCRKGGTPEEYDKESQCCESAGVLPKNSISNLDNCPNKVSKGLAPTVDGCSFVPDGPMANLNFTPACNGHDRCYGTCNAKKSDCDTAFYNDMVAICINTYGPEAAATTTCKALAWTYATGVEWGGGIAYNNAQKTYCKCCE